MSIDVECLSQMSRNESIELLARYCTVVVTSSSTTFPVYPCSVFLFTLFLDTSYEEPGPWHWQQRDSAHYEHDGQC